jgi:hypothetical protein
MADLTAMLQAAAGQVGGEYQISRSLRFNSADSAYLSRTFSAPTAGTKWTWSSWVKRSALYATKNEQTLFGTQGAGAQGAITFSDSSDFIQFKYSGAFRRSGPVSFRDVSAWYHIVVSIDTTDATESNRAKLYVNGIQQTWTTSTSITQNDTTQINQNAVHNIGSNSGASSSEYSNIYLAETYFIDGSALTPSSFGETNATTGVWSPIAYAGSYGTNGFYLNFSDNSDVTAATLGKDDSGNGNNWTPSGFSVTAGAGNDSLVDTPTQYGTDTGAGGEVRGNYATLNPLSQSSAITLSNGNLNFSTAAAWNSARSTVGMTSGKWYWEVQGTAITSHFYIGVATSLAVHEWGSTAGEWVYVSANGNKANNGSASAYGATYTDNDVIGVALDLDAGTLTFYKNGVSQGTAFSGLPSGTYFAGISSAGVTGNINFGQRPFEDTAPSGFKALVTTNLPEPTVVQGDDYFNTVLYTGTGSSLGVTGVGFQPDWVWIKERNAAADHALYDAVRGVTKQLESNTTTEETTEATGLTAFGSDGFTVGSLAQVNTSTDTYVAWNWKADGAGASNTAGTISSTVSVSTTSGFSIVTYTGTGSNATVGHGLGAAPAMYIVKCRNASGDIWDIYNKEIGPTKYLRFASNAAAVFNSWQDTNPTSDFFYISTDAVVNTNGNTYVAYCFAPISGFSALGSYTGNGSADGPFVYTGFRPAWVLFKATTSGGDWVIEDVARSPTNQMDARLFPSTFDEETSNGNGNIDYLSNGFKLRNSHSLMNTSAETYIYMAFASNPFKYSLAR